MKQDNPPTTSEMLHSIQQERQKLEDLLDGLPEDRLTASNVQEAWSVKDILAHIAAWERLTLERLRAARTGEALRIPPIKTDAQIDAMNASIYAQNKERPLKEILAEFQSAHRALLDEIASLEEAFFQGPIPAEWGQDRPVWELVGANTCWHYPEHTAAIEKWMGL